MIVDLRYLGRSRVERRTDQATVNFAPNLARRRVSFDGEVAHPVRFREAISALHAVVVGDLRRPPKDRSAWLAWKADEQRREQALRAALQDQARAAELAKLGREPVPPNLDDDFKRMHELYWTARRRWANELMRNDPELFRHLVPCDPIVTVADDVVFFECFSKDESAYACLSVDRDAFRDVRGATQGTTNVDYSLALFEHFQTLRSYRATRLCVDPTGFEVKVEGRADYREEKIDLPPSWLRGFGQLQAALTLPARTVELSVEAVYSILAWLRRHREKTGPRCLRFQLVPGQPAAVVLEPWGVVVPGHGAPYQGSETEEIKVWGRRRLASLARLLPLADKVQVRLLGSGMPSIWTARLGLGDSRFVLALSGWTANDWTGGASLEQLGAARPVDPGVTETIRLMLPRVWRATLPQLARDTGAPRDVLQPSLQQLAREGQVIYDFVTDEVRWREVMPQALSAEVLGPPPPELAAARALALKVKVSRRETLGARLLLVANVDGTSCEAILGEGGSFSRATCTCSYFHKTRLRAGPCRHLIALRLASRIFV